MAAPMILGLNDGELEAILEASAAAGARRAGYQLVRLPWEVKDVFVSWLEQHFPDAAPRVLSLIRESRGGELNVSRFGERMRGTGPFADLLKRRFELACRRLELNRTSTPLDLTKFQPPPRPGDQLSLFR
jgi:DNA repair photolyase